MVYEVLIFLFEFLKENVEVIGLIAIQYIHVGQAQLRLTLLGQVERIKVRNDFFSQLPGREEESVFLMVNRCFISMSFLCFHFVHEKLQLSCQICRYVNT